MYISREDGVQNVHIQYSGQENLLHGEKETPQLRPAIAVMFNPAILMHQ